MLVMADHLQMVPDVTAVKQALHVDQLLLAWLATAIPVTF